MDDWFCFELVVGNFDTIFKAANVMPKIDFKDLFAK